jgi:putative heme iron utilization protein
MKKYEVLYMDRHVEVVDFETVDKLIDELEMFERFDVSQIHELKEDGDFETIWTEEEGLFVRGFGYDVRDEDDF